MAEAELVVVFADRDSAHLDRGARHLVLLSPVERAAAWLFIFRHTNALQFITATRIDVVRSICNELWEVTV